MGGMYFFLKKKFSWSDFFEFLGQDARQARQAASLLLSAASICGPSDRQLAAPNSEAGLLEDVGFGFFRFESSWDIIMFLHIDV